MTYKTAFIFAAMGLTQLPMCFAKPQRTQPIEPAQFQFESQGSYGHRVDERRLMHIFHPLSPSRKGDFGVASARTSLPSSAKPPFYLSFYLSDNNEASNLAEPPSIASRSGAISVIIDERTGHRYQKCWIDGVEIWQRDTIEDNKPTLHTVDITKYVSPGKEFELRFGMQEEVDSTERLPKDRFVQSNAPESGVHAGMEFSKYETRSYWGDFLLHWGGERRPVLRKDDWAKPVESAKVAASEPLVESQYRLEIEKHELLKSRWAWPVSMGIPFPQGALREPSIALSGREGSLPARSVAMNQWPDGSIRWARMQFTLPAGLKDETIELSLAGNSAVLPEGEAVKASSIQGRETIANGLLKVELKPKEAEVFTVRSDAGKTLIKGLEVFFESAGSPLKLQWNSVEAEETSEWQVKRTLIGLVTDSAGNDVAQVRFSVDLYANVPYLHTRLTMINLVGQDLVLKEYGYRLGTVGKIDMGSAKDGLLRGDASSGGWVAVVKNFKHLWPNDLREGNGGLELLCFKGGDEKMPMLKLALGEALGSEMWLAFENTAINSAEAVAFAKMVETPPRLNSSALIRKSGVWGKMVELNAQHPMYGKFIENHLAEHYAEAEEGLRWYGNFRGGLTENFYWNSIHSMYTLYALTGERRWFDWAERSADNMMDHLVAHVGGDGREAGGVRFWDDATKPMRFDVKTQTCNGLFDYWGMTGDQRAYRLAKGIADFIVEDHGMKQSLVWPSARYQGWSLIFLMAAYQETADPRYLEAARKALKTVDSCVDPRRGAYLEHHGNPSFKGIIPFMNGILMTGLREMHQQTGDEEAAKLLVKIAWGTYAEMGVPDRPGYYEYSPDPYKRSVLATLNPGICAGQAYAAALTSDVRLYEIANEGWEAFLKEAPHKKRTFAFCYDLPATLFWLHQGETEVKKVAKSAAPLKE